MGSAYLQQTLAAFRVTPFYLIANTVQQVQLVKLVSKDFTCLVVAVQYAQQDA